MLTNNTKAAIDNALREAGEELRRNFGQFEPSQLKYKSDRASEVVTAFDVSTEELIRDRLHTVEPSISFVGEETGGDRNTERFWMVDPIDGTAHFIRGIPFCTTMLALIEGGIVTYAAIYNFAVDDMYIAERGGGATLNGKSMQVSNRELKGAYLGYETQVSKEENREVQRKVYSHGVALVKTISAGYEFCLVASGKLDGRIQLEPYGNDYDFAAGSLLVSEAGGVVANIGSTEYDYTNLNFLATNPVVFEQLTKGGDAVFPLG